MVLRCTKLFRCSKLISVNILKLCYCPMIGEIGIVQYSTSKDKNTGKSSDSNQGVEMGEDAKMPKNDTIGEQKDIERSSNGTKITEENVGNKTEAQTNGSQKLTQKHVPAFFNFNAVSLVKMFLMQSYTVFIVVHVVLTFIWASGFYFMCHSGIDMIALLSRINLQEAFLDYFRDSALSSWLITFFLMKVLAPVRYVISAGCTILVLKLMKKYKDSQFRKYQIERKESKKQGVKNKVEDKLKSYTKNHVNEPNNRNKGDEEGKK